LFATFSKNNNDATDEKENMYGSFIGTALLIFILDDRWK